ncbi:hypothetical protein F4695_001607 [Rhizobium soli]|uniref:Uncharacterized protein n=1 Tax=Rhizobium soli TaxID=424798 RepID=A0A7X0JIN2_9HYPH|nr:hypothetical protein [Rhizobium soli]
MIKRLWLTNSFRCPIFHSFATGRNESAANLPRPKRASYSRSGDQAGSDPNAGVLTICSL